MSINIISRHRTQSLRSREKSLISAQGSLFFLLLKMNRFRTGERVRCEERSQVWQQYSDGDLANWRCASGEMPNKSRCLVR